MPDKNKKGRALGKGLDSIFGTDVEEVLKDIENGSSSTPGKKESDLPIAQIRPNPYQPRKDFDSKALQELADSIKVHGVFTPLIVRKAVQGYDLVAGERRLRASKLAGLETVPAVVVEFTDEQMMEIALLENVQRENLNPIEEATAYDNLMNKFGYTQEKLSQQVGKSREYCANIMRLLNLPSEVQQLLVSRKLTSGHARALLSLKDEDQMSLAAQEILQSKMSVRQAETYVKSLLEGKTPEKKKVTITKDPWVSDLERQLSQKLSTKVEVGKKDVTIHYSSTKDLNRILEILGCLEEE